MSYSEYFIYGTAAFLLFRIVRELMYIKLYAFIIRLQSEGKLGAASDPAGISKSVKQLMERNSTL